jgi:hypothetical protein
MPWASNQVDDVLVLVTGIADYGEKLGGPIFLFHIRRKPITVTNIWICDR